MAAAAAGSGVAVAGAAAVLLALVAEVGRVAANTLTLDAAVVDSRTGRWVCSCL